MRYGKAGNTARHHHPEEPDIAECLFDIARHHTRQEQPEEHKCRAEREVRRAVCPLGEVHHIEHTRSVAQAVPQLLYADADGDNPKRIRLIHR